MEIGSKEEEFFLKRINVERVFEFTERTDYLFLYNIKECIKKSNCPNGTYLTEIAEQMDLSITETSKAVKNLEEKGYVTWKLDEDKEKTNLDRKAFACSSITFVCAENDYESIRGKQ